MFDDYKEKVILAYQKKRNEDSISIRLLQLSPAKLRDECFNIYRERRLPKDEKILKEFFELKDDAEDFAKIIKNFEIDKFKPLINFLNRKTNHTDIKNIDLLAWLIDFEPRPFKFEHNYKDAIEEVPAAGGFKEVEKAKDIEFTDVLPDTKSPDKENTEKDSSDREYPERENTSQTEPDTQQESEEEITDNYPEPPPPYQIQTFFGKINGLKILFLLLKFKKAIPYLIIIAVTSAIYLFLNIRNQECMYWTGDHYESISCNQKLDGTPVFALDTIKVAHLKKITNPDTLTQKSLGRVWYAKIDGGVEFYTSDGYHPLYNDLKLRPITTYILKKYVYRD